MARRRTEKGGIRRPCRRRPEFAKGGRAFSGPAAYDPIEPLAALPGTSFGHFPWSVLRIGKEPRTMKRLSALVFGTAVAFGLAGTAARADPVPATWHYDWGAQPPIIVLDAATSTEIHLTNE